MTKIVKTEELKIHIFLRVRDLMNFNEIFGKIVTYDDIKSGKKTKPYTLFRQYIFLNIFLLRVIVWSFFK